MFSLQKSQTHPTFQEKLLQNISVVLKSADDSTNVLSTSIPSEFLESQPALIGQSFLNYLNEHEDFKVTTINERLEDGHYKSVYPLYHDIRLSAYILLNQLDIGSEQYVKTDRFYKFSTEFILRETFRFSTDIHQFNTDDDDFNDEESDFEELISQDFVKISTTYTLANTEAYFTYTAANIPLFTSLSQRSALDERLVTPPQGLHVTSILPHTVPSSIAQTLDMISPTPTRILQQQQGAPNPPIYNTGSLQPYPTTDILDRFLHPNWYSLPTAKWLEGSDLQSFAPSVDEQTAVVTSVDKGRLWLENIGYNQLFKINGKEAEKKNEDKHTNGGSDDMEVDEKFVPLILDDIELEEDVIPTKGSISLTNIFEWHPSNTLTATEIEIFEKGEELQYINLLLSRLSTLRSEREPKTPPSDEEVQIYHKTNFLLKEIILSSDEVPSIELSKYIPLLQTNYHGVLPIPNQNAGKKKLPKSRR